MGKEKSNIKNKREFDKKLENAIVYGEAEDVRKLLKTGFKVEPNEMMSMIMWHCNDLEDVKVLKEMGYDFKDDQKCIEEFVRHAALKPEILQYMLDNGAIVSWKAIQLCANRYSLDVLRVLVNAKKDFFPID